MSQVWDRFPKRYMRDRCGGDGVTEENIEIQNEIAQNLLAAEIDSDPRYDASARNLVAEKPILAYILKSALDEYKDYLVQEIAEKFIEGVPEVRMTAIHQDHPDRQPTASSTHPASEEKANDRTQAGIDDMMSGDDKIEGLPTVEKSQREGALYFDIRFLAIIPQSGELVEIYVNVEIQNDDTPGYPIPKRGFTMLPG